MRLSRGGGVLAAGLALIPIGCRVGNSSDCGGGCTTSAAATFHLACFPNDITSAAASSPCTVSDLTFATRAGMVDVLRPSPGTCHVVLTFATGFTYATDVTFASLNEGCGCPNYIGPAMGGPFTVNNPPDTCVALPDAGGRD
ncbi:MAG TPA: hypothetical protein VF765_31900 [Polyangiaceae bacterium]